MGCSSSGPTNCSAALCSPMKSAMADVRSGDEKKSSSRSKMGSMGASTARKAAPAASTPFSFMPPMSASTRFSLSSDMCA